MDEYEQPTEDGGAPSGAEAVEDHRPLIVRIGDKNWKTRLTAYENLREELIASAAEDGGNALFTQYGPWLSKMTADTNSGALDTALDTAITYADLAPSDSVKLYASGEDSKMFLNIVDKSFSAKSSTLAKGKALLLKVMEVTDPKACTLFLLSKLADKKPKVPPTCLEVIKTGMTMFSVQPFPVKEIIAAMGPVLNGTNGSARELCLSLMLEMTAWIGKAPFNSLLDSIRSAQKTEFEKMCAEKDAEDLPSPIPTVWLRKDRPEPGSEATFAASRAKKDDGGREYLEEVDIVKKLKPSEYSTLIVSEKWSEQVKALQLVIDGLGPTPKIKSGCDVHDIVAACKGFLRQPGSHLQVLMGSMKVITLLAEGMRAEFSSFIRPTVQSIIGKCKEKKLVTEVQGTLALILRYCLSFESLSEDVLEHIRNKKVAPHGRVCMMDFVAQIFSETELAAKVNSDALKPLADALVSCCEDSDPKIRDGSALALAAMAPIVKSRGKPALEAHKILMSLEQSMPRVFKKIQQAMESGSSDSGPGPSAGSGKAAASRSGGSSSGGPPPAPAAAASTGNSRFDDDYNPPAPPARAVSKKPAASSSSSSAAPKKAVASAAGAKKASSGSNEKEDDTVEDLAMTPQDAEDALAALEMDGWADTVQAAMNSPNWQLKSDAVTAIGEKIAELELGGIYSAPLVVYLSAKTGGFKISNTNILKAVIQTACQAASHTGTGQFSKPAAWELIKHLGDKLSDKKTKDLVGSLLSALSAAVRPVFVVKRMQYVMDKTKAPLAHQYYLEWLKDAITEHGAASFPVPALGAFCQVELDNKVAAVRTAAVEVMGVLYHQIGPRLAAVAMSDDMKPAVRALLEAEYSRVGHDPASGKPAKAGDSDGLSIPRSDISSLLDKNILAELNLIEGKTSWQNRKAAIESIISACERSGHYLDASKGASAGLSEILKSLKARVNDTQANLKPIAAVAIGHVIASLDPEQGCKYLKSIAGGLIAGLADNKKGMRDSTVSALQMAVTLNRPGGDAAPAEMSLLAVLIGPFAEALAATVVGRQELLAFLSLYAEAFHPPIDCSDLPTPLVIAMQDKTAAVRSLAESLLGVLNARALISKTALDKATRDLAPAAKRTLMPSVERMISLYGTRRAGGAVIPKGEDDESVGTASTAATAPRSPPPPVRSNSTLDRRTSAPTIVVPEKKIPVVQAAHSPVARGVGRQPSVTSSAATSIAASMDLDDASGGSSLWMLKKMSQQQQQRRLEDFHRQNWPLPPEEIGLEELSALRVVWEPLIAPDLAALIFAVTKGGLPNQDGCINAVNELLNQLHGPYALQHTDLLLRYACYAMSLRETASGLLKVLSLITEIFNVVRARGLMLHEAEIACIMPHLIDKSGHKSERHRLAFKSALTVSALLILPGKMCQLLLQGLTYKNKRTRVVCIEEIQVAVESAGAAALGRAGVREVAVYLDSKDNDVSGRNASLELCYALYLSLGGELSKLSKLMGSDLSERSSSMVEDRVRQKNKQAGNLSAALANFANRSTASTLITASTTQSSTASSNRAVAPSGRAGSVPAAAVASPKRNVTLTASSMAGAAASNPTYNSPKREESSDSFEQSPSPFRLEITPPSAEPPVDNEQIRAYSKATPPRGLNSQMAAEGPTNIREMDSPTLPSMDPNWAQNTPNKSRQQSGTQNQNQTPSSTLKPYRVPSARIGSKNALDGIYADIANKVDQYLLALCTQAEEGTSTQVIVSLCDETKDYLKMLHSIAIGEWSQETLPEDDEALKTQIAPLCARLTRCVAASFSLPMSSQASAISLYGIDVSLVAVSLATLFAIVRRSDLAEVMDKDCLTDVFQECLRRIVDLRLGTSNGDASPKSQESSKETVQQIVRALNIVLLRLAAEAPSGYVMGSLIQVLFLCIPSNEVDHTGDVEAMPTASMKPTSRLLLRVLGEEAKKDSPFAAPLDIKALLVDIHVFLSRQPNVGTVDDTPLTAVKAVLSEIIKALGGEMVMQLLTGLRLSVTTMIFKLTGRISNLPLPTSQYFDESIGYGATSDEVHAQLVLIIDDITSARDKMVPIRQLHALKRENPSTDIHQYLLKISAAFRRFVLDTLAKLDDQDRENGLSTSQGQQQQSLHQSSGSLPSQGSERNKHVPSPYVRAGSSTDNAAEAMRIIEGLKNKPFASMYMQGRESPQTEPSPSASLTATRRLSNTTPRALMNDRIRGTLSNLSNTLDLAALSNGTNVATPPRQGGTTSAGGFPGQGSEKGHPLGSERGDNDLAARLQRLKNMEKK